MRSLFLLLAACACLLSSGCSICCTPWDYAYAGYGGKVPRDDMYDGRVGSRFHPAGIEAGVLAPPGAVVLPEEVDPKTKKAEENPEEKSDSEKMPDEKPETGGAGVTHKTEGH